MKPEELKQMLEDHAAWLKGTGGKRADLSGVNLAGASLTKVNLAGASLTKVNLSGANLSGANLTRAYLAGASLTKVNLAGANLRGAYLAGANLAGANLAGANLRGANLRGVDLTEVHLSQTKGVKWVAMSAAKLGAVGRQWLVVEIDGEPRWFCGCFQGSTAELRTNIEVDVATHKKSRMRTMEVMLELLRA